ncbi:tRNA 2-thiouridine(34) synthase MnmA [Aureimonas leprariae]|uniref:tRNA-specific 2-thiouridylase MnmA n=1 Tax=Plantimonas leprariae TaxID=2615207 RepID=A0A7V7TY94_9HYPH|nr:tRNA 2-thiouridine(34) synthase MnmA [Aureimonas leprariae]KAB0682516.1 tRNA 2-thiouridine(34) synthase MnmA [Aureimonas leprariae]
MTNSLDLSKAPKDCRVVVAMSGGVDSSVVAAMLKAEGYDVVGITLQLYDSGAVPRRAGACCAGQDIRDAKRVSEALGIPHYVLDYEEAFRAAVIDPFAASYVAGETPVPCISCNQTVKFRDLLAVAKDLGADALATGHYIESRALAGQGGRRGLYRPRDLDRDQSYFLFATTQEQVDFLRFPLGAMTKAETRAIAERHGLIVADKPDSQDICFVANGRYGDVIERLRPGAGVPGDIVHVDGRVLGRHEGIVHFTVGQRRGLRIAAPDPLYVVAIDAPSARVVVGPRSALRTSRLTLREANWLGGPLTEAGSDIFVKVRSSRAPAPARLVVDGGRVTAVELLEGEEGVAKGQAAVFYDGVDAGARVLGGGIVAEALPDALRIPAEAPVPLAAAAGG